VTATLTREASVCHASEVNPSERARVAVPFARTNTPQALARGDYYNLKKRIRQN
jgi:hypothetical protein